MSELTLQTMRTANQAREADGQRTENRKKNLLLLVMHYLSEEGRHILIRYVESANSLSKETNLDFKKYDVCDNVDLETVLMEYESYYFVKFNKFPKITKKNFDNDTKVKGKYSTDEMQKRRRASVFSKVYSTNNSKQAEASSHAQSSSAGAKLKSDKLTENKKYQPAPTLVVEGKQECVTNEFEVASQKCCSLSKQKTVQIIDFRNMINQETRINAEEGQESFERLLKPLGNFMGYTGEWRELALTVSRDIFLQNPNVYWDDIVGLEGAKRLVKEAVVYPIKYPQLFTGILSPWKGLLLYGPPGTGKTLLAKAVATECNTTFFNISASTIVSKWRGDSEKLVRVLFELARFHAPSTIFLDELDSLMSQRGSHGASTGSEHEGSRRMKTELLMQMDGLAKSDDLVFLLAASNIPWELDHAMLRRLEKRILVDLPTKEARKVMFKNLLPPVPASNNNTGLELSCRIDYDKVADLTEGYSGSDIRLVCKEAAMRVVRSIFAILENPASHMEGIERDVHVKLEPVTTGDVEAALQTTMPSASKLSGKYQDWQRQYGSA
ncbi:Katanin p60 ATPase-containing subunit A-like 2 [Cichlidogyrus casuarinus]|uniref:Katanin p60 ATPase-containing subunit A-like 2 n=1 Tax=Cichlidogyrus casuarinus TaxID=1844966 RepID=A0ABD2Q266_9PLAT